jgi:preprotein translocase subunit SecD
VSFYRLSSVVTAGAIVISGCSPLFSTPTRSPALHGEFLAVGPGGTPLEGELRTAARLIGERLREAGLRAVVSATPPDRIELDVALDADQAAVRELATRRGVIRFVPLPPSEYGTVDEPGPSVLQEGDAVDSALPALFGREGLASIERGFDTPNAQDVISFEFSSAATSRLANYSTDHVGEFFAIVMDGKALAVPSIRAPITGGKGQIAGNWSEAELVELIALLKFGPLPVELTEVRLEPAIR